MRRAVLQAARAVKVAPAIGAPSTSPVPIRPFAPYLLLDSLRRTKDRRGATYEQLARIAYLLGIDKHEGNARKMWYRIARDVMLSEAHADHIIGGLKAAGNPNREVSQ